MREDAPRATAEQILRAHSMDHIDNIMSVVPVDDTFYPIDGDTILSARSGEAMLRAAGAVCAAVDEVATGRCRNAFCAIRPPGHHAGREIAMGFCFLSNAAIGALHAQEAHAFGRVAVIDFDVHHGNGTQEILWDRAGMFYASTHQQDAFPYTGRPEETGGPGGGKIVNVPLVAGSGSDAFRAAYPRKSCPNFAPSLPNSSSFRLGSMAMRRIRWLICVFRWPILTG